MPSGIGTRMTASIFLSDDLRFMWRRLGNGPPKTIRSVSTGTIRRRERALPDLGVFEVDSNGKFWSIGLGPKVPCGV